MATRLTCLACTVVGVVLMTMCTYTMLPEHAGGITAAPSAFVGAVRPALRSGFRTMMNAEKKGQGKPTEFDKSYGQAPPTEAPFETSNNIFLVFSVISILALVGFVALTSGDRLFGNG
mmetsp:Transcript_57611/g.148196  ORF Transcript_57611/g.148196 Transcript_57611/m.148196 type:complete len:118 (-) Transcript_57611:65-418(-)